MRPCMKCRQLHRLSQGAAWMPWSLCQDARLRIVHRMSLLLMPERALNTVTQTTVSNWSRRGGYLLYTCDRGGFSYIEWCCLFISSHAQCSPFFVNCLPGHFSGSTSCQIRRRRRLLGAPLRAIEVSRGGFYWRQSFRGSSLVTVLTSPGRLFGGPGMLLVAYDQTRLAGEWNISIFLFG
jgi:hypothetical protein